MSDHIVTPRQAEALEDAARGFSRDLKLIEHYALHGSPAERQRAAQVLATMIHSAGTAAAAFRASMHGIEA